MFINDSEVSLRREECTQGTPSEASMSLPGYTASPHIVCVRNDKGFLSVVLVSHPTYAKMNFSTSNKLLTPRFPLPCMFRFDGYSRSTLRHREFRALGSNSPSRPWMLQGRGRSPTNPHRLRSSFRAPTWYSRVKKDLLAWTWLEIHCVFLGTW